MATAAQRYMDISYERDSAQEIVNIQFASQGEKNPHAAAHYGIYAFKSVRPLSFFDTGISSYTGVSVWLEAHKQNEAEGEPARAPHGPGHRGARGQAGGPRGARPAGVPGHRVRALGRDLRGRARGRARGAALGHGQLGQCCSIARIAKAVGSG